MRIFNPTHVALCSASSGGNATLRPAEAPGRHVKFTMIKRDWPRISLALNRSMMTVSRTSSLLIIPCDLIQPEGALACAVALCPSCHSIDRLCCTRAAGSYRIVAESSTFDDARAGEAGRRRQVRRLLISARTSVAGCARASSISGFPMLVWDKLHASPAPPGQHVDRSDHLGQQGH